MAGIMVAQLNYYDYAASKGAKGFKTLSSIASDLGVDQSQAYTQYTKTCTANPSWDAGLFDPSSGVYLRHGHAALEIARAMVWGKCKYNNPLAAFEANLMEYWGSGYMYAMIAGSYNLNIAKLREVRDNKLREERSFRASVITSGALDFWKTQPNLKFLQLSGGNPQYHNVIFEGEGASWVVISDDINPIHPNWQCEQKGGNPIVWAMIKSPGTSITNGFECKACPGKVRVWEHSNLPKECA